MWINETAFRQEGIATIVTVAIICRLGVNTIIRVLLIGSALLVMIAEALNSTIKAVVDRTDSEYHELSGRARDMRLAVVLLVVIITLIIWEALLWSYCR